MIDVQVTDWQEAAWDIDRWRSYVSEAIAPTLGSWAGEGSN